MDSIGSLKHYLYIFPNGRKYAQQWQDEKVKQWTFFFFQKCFEDGIFFHSSKLNRAKIILDSFFSQIK